MARVTIILQQDEREALRVLAEQERRDPRQQAALCIRRELERRGLLPPADQHDHQAQGREMCHDDHDDER